MNVRQIDLNLLVVFDALMTHRSVTRAADELCLSQPAVSQSLRRLRNMLDDLCCPQMNPALDRTVLANERTYAAWIRNALLKCFLRIR